MSAMGHKQTCAAHKLMSAFGPIADIRTVAEMERPPRGGLPEICSDVRVTRWKNGR